MSFRFLNGADISFVDEIEQAGGGFYDKGRKADVLTILRNSGINSIRLRLWHSPPGGFCNFERTLYMAKRIKRADLHFLLDFHYSDMWADPDKQYKPKAWEGLGFEKLKDVVYSYTKEVLENLAAHGAAPDMVQVGNEIINGMLWDEGRVSGGYSPYNTPEQWKNFASLVQAGIQGVRNALKDQADVMIHIDRGGDNENSRMFFDQLEQLGVVFDVIGLSYYPWWHGSLQDLEYNLNDLSKRYQKPIIVVETAYPWTLAAEGGRQYIVSSEEQLHPGYPATEEGQKRFLTDLIRIIRNVPHNRGMGVYYWEPCWIPAKDTWSVGHDNQWSNLTLFDFKGHKLSSLDAFKVYE